MSKKDSKVYRLRVDLLGTKPPIWRRIEVQGGTLEDLHHHIQIAMGWTDSHMHAFEVNGKYYSIPYDDGYGGGDELDSGEMSLSETFKRNRQTIRYTYDFGDSWEHSVKVEEISEPASRTKYPRCTAGKGNCPPEDCGGVWGFYGMLDALEDPEHPEHDHYSEWLEDYDPEEFDAKKTTKKMQ